MKILIGGGPRCGKSTAAAAIAAALGISNVRATDTTKDMEWSEASALVARWISEPGPWIIEGVVVPRAIRKWYKAGNTGKPADAVLWFDRPVVERTPGQDTMGKGCLTVWNEVEPVLRRAGVEVQVNPEVAR